MKLSKLRILSIMGFGGLVVSMLASGTQDRKNPQHAFFGGGEVKPSPMSQICAACQRTLGLRGHFSPVIPSFADVACTWRHLEVKVATSKGGGKQWQTTPKKLPRTQCARAIPVAWLGSGSCQNRRSGWILMMNDDDGVGNFGPGSST